MDGADYTPRVWESGVTGGFCPAPRRARLSVHPPTALEHRRSRRAPPVGPWSRPLSRPAEAERCFLCHSPTLRPWITDHWLRMCAVVAVLRGGALEPEPHVLSWKSAG